MRPRGPSADWIREHRGLDRGPRDRARGDQRVCARARDRAPVARRARRGRDPRRPRGAGGGRRRKRVRPAGRARRRRARRNARPVPRWARGPLGAADARRRAAASDGRLGRRRRARRRDGARRLLDGRRGVALPPRPDRAAAARAGVHGRLGADRGAAAATRHGCRRGNRSVRGDRRSGRRGRRTRPRDRP